MHFSGVAPNVGSLALSHPTTPAASMSQRVSWMPLLLRHCFGETACFAALFAQSSMLIHGTYRFDALDSIVMPRSCRSRRITVCLMVRQFLKSTCRRRDHRVPFTHALLALENQMISKTSFLRSPPPYPLTKALRYTLCLHIVPVQRRLLRCHPLLSHPLLNPALMSLRISFWSPHQQQTYCVWVDLWSIPSSTCSSVANVISSSIPPGSENTSWTRTEKFPLHLTFKSNLMRL
jgi:hypothetical protein